MLRRQRSVAPSVPTARLWIAVFAGYLALGATLQLLPTWVTGHLAGSEFAAGAAVGLAFVATAAMRPVAGTGADRGRPQRFILLGGVLVAIGSLGSMLATSMAPLLVGRVVMGAGEALLFGAAIPWVLSTCPPERRGHISGLFGLSMWGGLALGPVCTSVIEDALGQRQVWYAVVILAVASACVAGTAMFAAPPAAATPHIRLSLGAFIPQSAVLPGIVFGVAGYGYGAVSAGLVLFMNHHHLATPTALPAFAASFLGVRSIGSHLVDRYGGPVVATGSLTVAAAGGILLSCTSSTPPALLGAILLGAGTSLMFPATVAWSLRRRTGGASAGQGASIGVSTSFWDLGIAVGGVLTGLSIKAAGYSVTWAVTAGFLLVAAGIAAVSAATDKDVAPRLQR